MSIATAFLIMGGIICAACLVLVAATVYDYLGD